LKALWKIDVKQASLLNIVKNFQLWLISSLYLTVTQDVFMLSPYTWISVLWRGVHI